MLVRFGDVLSFLFGWSTIQSAMRVSDPDHLLFDYPRMMMGFRLFNPEPKYIEMIGLGGGSLANACYRCLPHSDITVVDIDPEVIALRQNFRIPPYDDRFRVICVDGIDFVATATGKPDVLVIDGFDGKGLLQGLSGRPSMIAAVPASVPVVCWSPTFATTPGRSPLVRHIAGSFDDARSRFRRNIGAIALYSRALTLPSLPRSRHSTALRAICHLRRGLIIR
jgi:spermidine synthase